MCCQRYWSAAKDGGSKVVRAEERSRTYTLREKLESNRGRGRLPLSRCMGKLFADESGDAIDSHQVEAISPARSKMRSNLQGFVGNVLQSIALKNE